MADKKTDQKVEHTGCKSCGESRTLLSEEKDSPPKCAGCGRSVGRLDKN